MLLTLTGTYAVATPASEKDTSHRSISEEQTLLNKIVKKDSIILSETREARKSRVMTVEGREHSSSRKARTPRMERKTRLSRVSRIERRVIYLAFLR